MQQFQTFAGIDISKLTLDICLLKGDVKNHFVIPNEPKAITGFFIAHMDDNLVIGMENTGCYNHPLYEALTALSLDYYVIPPLHLKKSLGLSRGKNDKTDAARIAQFLDMNLKHLAVYKPQRPAIRKLQLLLTMRNQRIKIRKQVQANREHYNYEPEDHITFLAAADQALIEYLNEEVKDIEKQINLLIASDEQLSATYKLISSVQGVGKVLSWNLLVRTGEFQHISTPRKLACYAGVVPFDHQSGTSIRGRSRVSHYADKNLKQLLHMAAMSAIRLAGDLKDYYDRKVAEGKNKMSVLNAVRNKIIHRVYAVIKCQRTYQNYLPQSLLMS